MPVGPLHYLPCNSRARLPHDLPRPHSTTHVDFGRARNPNYTRLKWVVFHWAPEATWCSMNGIGWPPPNTAKRVKAMRIKPLTTSQIPTKTVTIHPAMRQTVTVYPYSPNWIFAHKSKKAPNHCFFVFNCNFPCMRLWTLKVINPCTLALWRCQKLPNFLQAYLKPFQPFRIASYPVHTPFSSIPGI